MSADFAKRLIRLTVQLATNTQTNQPNTFVESGSDTVTLSGSRTSVRIQNSGAPANSTAQVKVWGMTPSLMNQLATLGLTLNLIPRNALKIEAGTADANGIPTNMSIVFYGTIIQAYADFTAQPDVPFIFGCQSGVASAVISAPPSSFPGSADVATIMSGLARALNLGFVNHGVSLTLSNPYLSGSYYTQAQKVAEHAGISWGLFNGNTLEIWPKLGNRKTNNIPIISPDTGMIGYPSFTSQGIIVQTLFNPQIAFGGLIKVEGSLLSGIAAVAQQRQTGASPANSAATFPSQWAVNKLDLDLDSLLPKGQWSMTAYAYNPGAARGILPPA